MSKETFLYGKSSQVMIVSNCKVYMYGQEVPCNHADAVCLDEKNKNTKWQDAKALELKQLDKYSIFDN